MKPVFKTLAAILFSQTQFVVGLALIAAPMAIVHWLVRHNHLDFWHAVPVGIAVVFLPIWFLTMAADIFDR